MPVEVGPKEGRFQVGSDMLFEQIPAYLEFFGVPSTTAENLLAVARLDD